MTASPTYLETDARSTMYKTLARSFLYPTEEVYNFLRSPSSRKFFGSTWDTSPVVNGFLAACTDLGVRDDLEREYNRLFAHIESAKCPPYETEYGYDNVFQKTQAMADIAGFYRAYGLEVAEDNPERVDFISMELEFMSYLAAKEAYARNRHEDDHLEVCIDTQRKFLREHLGRWLGVFANILIKSTDSEFYKRLGQVAEWFVEADSATFGVHPQKIVAPKEVKVAPLEAFACGECSLTNTEAIKKETHQGESHAAFGHFDV